MELIQDLVHWASELTPELKATYTSIFTGSVCTIVPASIIFIRMFVRNAKEHGQFHRKNNIPK